MEDADDINNIANDLVDHDVGKGREDEFAGSLYLPRRPRYGNLRNAAGAL